MRRCPYCWQEVTRWRGRYCKPEHARADARHRAAVSVGRKRALDAILRRMHEKAKA